MKADQWRLDSILLGALLFFLYTEALAGPIRYYLGPIATLALLPKVLLATVAVLFLPIFIIDRSRRDLVWLSFGLLTSTVVGLLFLPATQVVVGLWVLVPFVAGWLVAPELISQGSRMWPWALGLWLIGILGLLLDLIFPLPWEGAKVEIAGQLVEVSRKWATGGLDRLAGFTRASFTIAQQILFSSIVVICVLRKRWAGLVWIVSGVAILLTTNKAALAAWVLVGLLLITPRAVRAGWKPVIFLTAITTILMPISTTALDYEVSAKLTSRGAVVVLGSFGDRLENTWPNALELVVSEGDWLLGRGMGSLGRAQDFGEPDAFIPPDNLAILVYAKWGALGILALTYIAIRFSLIRRSKSFGSQSVDQTAMMIALAVFATGLFVSTLEGPFTAIPFGWMAYDALARGQVKQVLSKGEDDLGI